MVPVNSQLDSILEDFEICVTHPAKTVKDDPRNSTHIKNRVVNFFNIFLFYYFFKMLHNTYIALYHYIHNIVNAYIFYNAKATQNLKTFNFFDKKHVRTSKAVL